MNNRQATLRRATRETRISLTLDLDGVGKASVKTGIPFFDHMLVLFAKHSTMDLKLRCQGDLEVDAHHTVEDCGLVLGQAFVKALGDKKVYPSLQEMASIHAILSLANRMCLWMNVSRDALLISESRNRRTWCGGAWNRLCAYKKLTADEKGQDSSSAFRFGLAREFFQAFANEGRCNLHLELLYGDEPHHIVEATFQGVCPCADVACQRDARIAGGFPAARGKL